MSKASGVGSGGAGDASAPPKFWFCKNPEKFLKICGNVGKMCENLRKIAWCAL